MSSRKITPIFVACIVSIGLITFAVTKDSWGFSKSNSVYVAENNGTSGIHLAIEKAIDAAAEKDTDGDGVKDWEETFKKSEAAGVATNGQTGSEGSGTSANQKTKDASNDPKTKTEEISRNLFSEYMQLKQSGKLNQDTMTNLVNKAVSQVDTGGLNIYSPSDIKTIPDTDVIGAKNYANGLVTIREKYRDLYKQNQIIIVGKTINFDDPASIESIDSTSKLYEATAKEMARLIVPKSLVASHVALLNDYVTSAEGLGELARLKTDPILALAGIQRHVDSAKQEPEIFSGISQFFLSRGLFFGPNEAGSRITKI